MRLSNPTDDNNTIKVDIYDKKDKINQIQFFLFEKKLKKLVPRGNTGHSINWSQEQQVVGIIGFHQIFIYEWSYKRSSKC